MPYEFLSESWVEAMRSLRDEYHGRLPTPSQQVLVNLVVTDTPFGTSTSEAHVDTREGQLAVDLGHLDDADVTITLDHATARQLFVDQDREAVMQAFFTGKILVQGDLAKLLAGLAEVPVEPEAEALAREIARRTLELTT